ncbi:MAG: hypothetical protein QOJ29_5064 [Thermoleophilaceae bacterium]|nr:hypothetical protein [Thermoleophilaceae bacterium]
MKIGPTGTIAQGEIALIHMNAQLFWATIVQVRTPGSAVMLTPVARRSCPPDPPEARRPARRHGRPWRQGQDIGSGAVSIGHVTGGDADRARVRPKILPGPLLGALGEAGRLPLVVMRSGRVAIEVPAIEEPRRARLVRIVGASPPYAASSMVGVAAGTHGCGH